MDARVVRTGIRMYDRDTVDQALMVLDGGMTHAGVAAELSAYIRWYRGRFKAFDEGC